LSAPLDNLSPSSVDERIRGAVRQLELVADGVLTQIHAVEVLCQFSSQPHQHVY